MSDKPEKIYTRQETNCSGRYWTHNARGTTEYLRADLANPSEVYDRIQGYIRVIQEKDALIADQAKPSEAIELLKGFIDSYGDIDIIQRLREKTQTYLTKINK